MTFDKERLRIEQDNALGKMSVIKCKYILKTHKQNAGFRIENAVVKDGKKLVF